MREIKFRCYDSAKKIMYHHKDLSVLAKNIKDDNIFSYMQYTGLKDKNGMDIYENDVIEFSTTEGNTVRHKVWWSTTLACFMIGPITYSKVYDSGFIQPSTLVCTVIGNIHQHPELLKTDK